MQPDDTQQQANTQVDEDIASFKDGEVNGPEPYYQGSNNSKPSAQHPRNQSFLPALFISISLVVAWVLMQVHWSFLTILFSFRDFPFLVILFTLGKPEIRVVIPIYFFLSLLLLISITYTFYQLSISRRPARKHHYFRSFIYAFLVLFSISFVVNLYLDYKESRGSAADESVRNKEIQQNNLIVTQIALEQYRMYYQSYPSDLEQLRVAYGDVISLISFIKSLSNYSYSREGNNYKLCYDSLCVSAQAGDAARRDNDRKNALMGVLQNLYEYKRGEVFPAKLVSYSRGTVADDTFIYETGQPHISGLDMPFLLSPIDGGRPDFGYVMTEDGRDFSLCVAFELREQECKTAADLALFRDRERELAVQPLLITLNEMYDKQYYYLTSPPTLDGLLELSRGRGYGQRLSEAKLREIIYSYDLDYGTEKFKLCVQYETIGIRCYTFGHVTSSSDFDLPCQLGFSSPPCVGSKRDYL